MDDSPPVSTFAALLDGVTRIEERLSRMERRLEQLDRLDELPNIVAVVADTLDQYANRLHARGVNLEERTHIALKLLERMTDPSTANAVTSMLELAGMLGPGPIDIVSRAGQALSQAQHTAPRQVGMFGLLRALSDPDVQHALGFATTFARELGRNLAEGPATRALPKDTASH